MLILSELNPRVNIANRVCALPGQVWGPRIIPDSQIIYVMSGQASLILGGDCINLLPGHCVFYGSETPHQLLSSESAPTMFASIHFDWNSTSAVPQHPVPRIKDCTEAYLSHSPKNYIVRCDNDVEIPFPHHFPLHDLGPIFMQIVDEFSKQEPGYLCLLKGLLLQLLAGIIRWQRHPSNLSDNYQKVLPAIHAIRDAIHKDWKIQELAHLCGYHPTYFTEMFKSAVHCSPKHFIVLERIAVAKDMLLEGSTVAMISEQLGYSSIHYFCRTFKHLVGMTPTEFRRRSTAL